MYLDDDRDVYNAINETWGGEFRPPNPETTFLGYKCPYNHCDIIVESHDYCMRVRQRLDAIAGEKYPNPNWFETFKWNWDQWLLKTHDAILTRAL